MFARGPEDLAGVRRGGYVLRQRGAEKPDLVLAATGSELALVLAAADRLEADGLTVRVVSIPNGNLFAREDESYRNEVLATGTPAVFIEAGSPFYWYQFLKGPGTVVGVESFGESAPGPEVYRHLGVTVDRVVDEARRLLATP